MSGLYVIKGPKKTSRVQPHFVRKKSCSPSRAGRKHIPRNYGLIWIPSRKATLGESVVAPPGASHAMHPPRGAAECPGSRSLLFFSGVWRGAVIERGEPEDRERGACAASDWLLISNLFFLSWVLLPCVASGGRRPLRGRRMERTLVGKELGAPPSGTHLLLFSGTGCKQGYWYWQGAAQLPLRYCAGTRDAPHSTRL